MFFFQFCLSRTHVISSRAMFQPRAVRKNTCLFFVLFCKLDQLRALTVFGIRDHFWGTLLCHHLLPASRTGRQTTLTHQGYILMKCIYVFLCSCNELSSRYMLYPTWVNVDGFSHQRLFSILILWCVTNLFARGILLENYKLKVLVDNNDHQVLIKYREQDVLPSFTIRVVSDIISSCL